MSGTDQVVAGFKAVLFADGLRLASKGIIILVLSRYLLTPDEYGLLFLALSILGVALLFSRLGLDKSAARFIAEFDETDQSQIPHVIRITAAIITVTMVLVGGVLVVGGNRIALLVGEEALTPLLIVGSVYVVGQTLTSFSTRLFQGFNRVTLSAVVRTVYNVALPVLVVSLALLGFGAFGALVGYAISALLAGIVGCVIVYLKFLKPYERSESRESGLMSRIFRYSIPLTATHGANVIDKRVDIVLVGYFLNPAATGVYTLGRQITEFVIAPAVSLGFTVSPTYGQRKASDEIEAAARIYETTFTYIIAIYIPAAAGIVLVAEPMISYVFGADYQGAAPVVQVLSVLVVVQAIDYITNDGLDYLGRARARAVAKGGMAVGNAALNIVLIPILGIVGAAATSVITYSGLVLFELYIVNQELDIDLRRMARATGTVCLITAGMAVAVLALLPYVSGIGSLLGVVLAGAAVWAVLAELSGVVDIRQVASMLV